jgi:GntR family transcriptional repressor for pyruvate dehydrogenase complex
MSLSSLLPIQRVSSVQEVVYRLEELLRTGELKPGQKLPPETELAKALQVSRPTLREALKGLNLLGLLVSRTGDGTYVGENSRNLFKTAIYFSTFLSAVDFMGLIEARIAIEPFLAEMAAQRATAQQIDRMRECLREMEAGLGSIKTYMGPEVAFHDEITKAAQSPVLQSIMESLRDLLLEGRMKITSHESGKNNLDLHVRIYEAIRKRKPALARRRMLEHLQDNRKHYEAFYRDVKVSSISQANLLPTLALPSQQDPHPSPARARR